MEDADPNVPVVPLTDASVSGNVPPVTYPVASPVAKSDIEISIVSGPESFVRLIPFEPVKFVFK